MFTSVSMRLEIPVPSKQLIFLAEAAISVAVWWAAQPEDERRMMQAKAWKTIEISAMRVAKYAANLAAKAEKNYKETVST